MKHVYAILALTAIAVSGIRFHYWFTLASKPDSVALGFVCVLHLIGFVCFVVVTIDALDNKET